MPENKIKENNEKNELENTCSFYENKYLSILRQEHIKAFEVRFSEAAYDLFHIADAKALVSEMMTSFEKQFKAGFKYNILILNTLNGGPTIIEESQNYLHETLFPFYLKHHINIHLFCLSEEVISKISMTLTSERDPEKRFENHYFSKYTDCVAWIKNKT